MNSLYTLALRQSSSVTSDLQSLSSLYASPPPPPSSSSPAATSALHTQITANLAALDRTIDDYDSMARREIVEVKREKAMMRVARFKEEYVQLRREYDRVKTEGQRQQSLASRTELFSPPSASTSSASASAYPHSSTASRSFARPSSSQQHPPQHPSQYPYSAPNDVSIPMGSPNHSSSYAANGGAAYDPRTTHALREHDFISQTGATLDAYLAQGQAVLGGLASQREVMK
ncbi:hypothetical protein JCM10213_002875, partial [Rhodosporidiobolus nylandii]